MDVYDTEKEQLEALKKWWRENGRMVVIGLVVGLGITFGWSGWKAYKNMQDEKASSLYEAVLAGASAAKPDVATVQTAAARLMGRFPDSPYASLAALVAARGAVQAGSDDDAARELQWVVEHTSRVEIREIAQLRLARIAVDRKDYDGAKAMLRQVRDPGLAGAVSELRGDIAVARGDTKAARAAYTAALANTDLSGAARTRIRIKLDDLGSYNVPLRGSTQ